MHELQLQIRATGNNTLTIKVDEAGASAIGTPLKVAAR